jgi:hypothetical protein
MLARTLRGFRIAWLAATMAACATTGCVTTAEVEPETPAPVESTSIETFHDELAPYGTWIDTPDQGRVWQPNVADVGEDFVPYATGGTWVYSDVGWTFETEWVWGWAAFHYGRWFHHPYHGWVWRPDMIWGPAWVDWRIGREHVGWAPLPPAGVVLGEGAWTFVETRDFVRHRVGDYAVPHSRVGPALRPTSPATGPRIEGGMYGGPSVTHIYRATGAEVQMRRITPPPRRVIRYHPHAAGHGRR